MATPRLLDRALQARGLPALGQSAASPWRGALQVLPLAFAASWAPFDAKALLDLLLLPRPPIGRNAARKLARALAREPGTGAAAWDRAWAELEADLAERFADHPSAEAEIARRRARWREWTTGGLYSRADGIPADAARRIAARVGQWAVETDAGGVGSLAVDRRRRRQRNGAGDRCSGPGPSARAARRADDRTGPRRRRPEP